jgi:2-polyprenyl-6-hydroxyphenyl methylase/3-demethylubiquinone-9 3-methyltransferase
MDQIKDNIYDAYYSKMGEAFGRKVRERVHWITQNTKGSNILDVGCSQGIAPILLGREGKKVLGLDVSTSAIEDAKKNLAREERETQDCVIFEKNNFFVKEFDKQFDTVILGEVLEHITDLESFFSKAVSLTKDEGRIIVTTPFGINDFIDHKRTFYLLDFLKLQTDRVHIEEVEFFGKWIGIIYQKKINEEKEILNYELLSTFEEAIYDIERNLVQDKSLLQEQTKRLNKELIQAKNDNNIVTKKLRQLERKYDNDVDRIKKDEKSKADKIQKELHLQYKVEENLLKQQKELIRQKDVLQKKYNNLKNSKLGKLTLNYWKWRRKK